MAAVTIKVGGRDYRIACDDGQEEHLRLLAEDLDERVASLVFGMGGTSPGEALSLLLTALTMSDELIELKKENEKLRRQSPLQAPRLDEARILEMEAAMAATLEDIAGRIEKIADQVEIR